MGDRGSSLVGVIGATAGVFLGAVLCGAIGFGVSGLLARGGPEGVYLGLWLSPVFLGSGAIVGGILGVIAGLAIMRRRG